MSRDVTVAKKRDALLPAGFPQMPDDLKRRVGLFTNRHSMSP